MKLTFHTVRDGIITGQLGKVLHDCGNCRGRCACIKITQIDLPEGIEASNGLIAYRLYEPLNALEPTRLVRHKYLGLGCGCYAKFHRQLAHITSSQEARSMVQTARNP